ncbi:MAG TPA: dienelactone hydrolase family protein, partial [Flavisolibacter sp.]|nr:dienelactone hydrolase family protein [Flavisolibacter sp.]
MPTKQIFFLSGFIAIAFAACNNENHESSPTADKVISGDSATKTVSVKEEAVTYTTNGKTMKSYVAYDEAKTGTRPIVLVVPEWWGLTEYPRMRAKMLAQMGYFAMAVDMYGEGKLAEDPGSAGTEATPFYKNPQLGKERLDAALAKAKTFTQADTTQTIAIGYCFGGTMALNYAKLGAPVAGVVSFHGNLQGVQPRKGTKAQFLICHGAADGFVPKPEIDAFKKSMDSAGLSYDFKVYEAS